MAEIDNPWQAVATAGRRRNGAGDGPARGGQDSNFTRLGRAATSSLGSYSPAFATLELTPASGPQTHRWVYKPPSPVTGMKCFILLAFLSFYLLALASASGQLRASQNQLFWVNGSWVPASQLKPGDRFMTPDGRVAVIGNITLANVTESAACHGLVTNSPHDFFANSILVHDASSLPQNILSTAAKTPATTTGIGRAPRREGLIDWARSVWTSFTARLTKR